MSEPIVGKVRDDLLDQQAASIRELCGDVVVILVVVDADGVSHGAGIADVEDAHSVHFVKKVMGAVDREMAAFAGQEPKGTTTAVVARKRSS